LAFEQELRKVDKGWLGEKSSWADLVFVVYAENLGVSVIHSLPETGNVQWVLGSSRLTWVTDDFRR